MNNKLKYFLFFIILFCLTNNVKADATLDTNALDLVSKAVFEVVVKKPIEDSLTYEKPLPLDLLPYYIRTDNYYSIGSAFAISPTEFITAVHVMNLALNSQFKEVYLRDKDKNVYSIDRIIKYSERRDFVVFYLKDKTTKDFFQININPRINEKVFAVGNALGEGIVIRDGLYTSNTPEDEKGEWKWIRFSAAASPGNSGGPLLDKDGKVIGIVLLKSPSENLNYALPIAEVINAKSNTAVVYSKGKYFLDNIYATKVDILKREFLLPNSNNELKNELREGINWFTYRLLKSLFIENKDHIFPNGNGARVLLHSRDEAVFPGIITQKENGRWYVSFPKEIKEAELPNNGHLAYGNLSNTLLLSIQKPDDVSLDKFYNDSKLFMDLLLKGFYLPRQVGTENIKITSLGKAREEYVFIDSYGRKWLVRTWLLEYSDEKFVTFSLPVPGGCITMLRAGQTGLVDDGHIPDLKVLTNFIYASYYGALKQWQEFLNIKELLASAFSSIDIFFDYNKTFHYKSKRLSFSYHSDVMDISEMSYMKLMFSYFKENDKTVWDIGAISVGENKGNETYFNITRNMEPSKELSDKYQSDWNTIVKQKFPFNNSAYYKEKTTNIATVVKKSNVTAIPVLYSIVYSKDGKIEQKEMATVLNKFIQNVAVYEDGKNTDVAYTSRKDAYHDKGDYYQAVYDYEKIADMNPQTIAGYLLRGDVYKDKGDLERASTDYGKAVEIDREYTLTYLGKDFIPLIYGVRGQFKEAKTEIENILKTDPLNISAELLLRAIEDALNQKIKNKTAVHLFKGEAFNYLGMPDEAFTEYNNAIDNNPDYHVSYDIRGLAKVFKKDRDGAISDYTKAIELEPKDFIAYNRRGVVYKLKEEYDKAVENFNKALEINPTYIKALGNRGDIYSLKSEYERAITDYDAVLQINPLDDNTYHDRGFAWYNKGEYDRAIEDYNKAIEINPKYVDVYINRGVAFSAKREYDHAIDDYNKAIELNPVSGETYNNRGVAYENKGDKTRALSDYNKAIELGPNNADAYNNRGNIYASKGNYVQAIADYNKAIEIDPKNDAVFFNRGLAYQKKEELDHAIEDYTKTIEINPKHAQAYFSRGLIYQNRKEIAIAISDYSKAIEVNPNYSEAYFNRGTIYKEKGDIDHAISDYSKVIEINPKNEAAYSNRGNSLHAKGELEQALIDYSKAIELNTKNENVYFNRGKIYQDKGNITKAVSDFSKSIELNPKFAAAYTSLGIIYAGRNEFESAIENYSKAIESDPKYIIAYINRGSVYKSKGLYDIALTDYNKAIEIDPKSAEAYNHRGAAYSDKGDLQRALIDLNKAIEINPNYADAYGNRGIIYGRKGDYNLAMADFNRAIEINPQNAEFYNSRGFTFKLMGKLDQAIVDFDQAIKLNPKHMLSYINRGNTYALKKDGNRACSDWKQACELGACDNYMQAKKMRYCE